MVHVGECRERNHTGKDDATASGRQRVKEKEKKRERETYHARLIPDFLETENWIVAGDVDLD